MNPPMTINLMSDTVTKPTPDMLRYMMEAEVGDDVFGEDPTANQLQEKVAAMFNHEAALFCPSGTMTNQIAIQLHTGDLGQLICEQTSHVYQYETGGYAYNARTAIKLIQGENGKITAKQVSESLSPTYDWLPESQLVVIENTCNKGGGVFYTLDEIEPIHKVCRDAGLSLHLDGARLFNALIETAEQTQEWGDMFDSVSICLSKGLGAPVGSLLIGSSEFIARARRYRKVMGGGMRQVGILAAAGIYALNHHVERLKEDHHHARLLADALMKHPEVLNIRPVQTNIVLAELSNALTAAEMVDLLKKQGILAVAMDTHLLRLVTHLDVTEEMTNIAAERIRKLAD